MIDVPDRLLRSDHVRHRHVDARRFHLLGSPLIQQSRMGCNAQVGEVAFELFDGRVITLVGNLVTAIGPAGEEEAAQVLEQNQIAHLALELRRARRRDHRLENFGLTMVAIERAGTAGNRESRKARLAAAFQFIAGIGTEGRGKKPQHAKRLLVRCSLQRFNQRPVERQLVERFDLLQ